MSSLSSFTNNNNHNMQTATTTTTTSLETLMSMTPLQVALMATVIYYTIMIVVSTISQLFGSSHNNNNNNNNNTTTTIPVGQTNNTHQKYDYDVIVIGAGIVGCTVGGSLAQQGKKVLIIERDLNEPDRIVGELLQPGGVEKLKQLGFGECLEGIDSPYMNGYGVFYGNERVHLPYPNRDFMNNNNNNNNSNNNNNNNSQSTSEKYHGRSFHYGKFIMNLRRRAQSMGKDKQSQLTLIQGSVCGFLYSPLLNHTTTAATTTTTTTTDDKNNIVHGVQYVSSLDGNEKRSVTSALVIVANGAGSTFTKSLNQSETVVASCFVGLKLKNAAHLLPFQNHGNVFMVDPAPVLCYPISSTDVRVLIDFPGSVAPNLTDEKLPLFLKNNVCPSLPLSMHEPFIKTIEEGNIRCALNREMPANLEFSKRGVIMLGDALNTRHPLTGGGMTVAFGDVQVLSELLRDVSDLTDYDAIDQAMKILSHRRKRYASTINILANALYAIFAPGDNDPMRSYMKKAVFNYFQLGGICATGPVALLSGLTESYHILLTHFFSVAIVGCFYECWPLPTPRALWTSLKLIKSAAMIVGPLIAEEKCLPFLFPKSIFKR